MKQTFVLAGAFMTACLLAPQARADRLDDFVAEAASKGRYSAVAQGLRSAHWWGSWNHPTLARAEAVALSGCNKVVPTGCQIIAVDGKFNGKQRRSFSTPASIIVYDHVSGAKQSLSGELRRTNAYQEVSDFQLVTSAGKVVCSGNLKFSSFLGIGTFSGTGQCLGRKATHSTGSGGSAQRNFRMDYEGSYMEVTLNY